ncbi:MAG: cell filamentation protein Fic [Candidatus Moranbacteria bacterium]|nr:cell filamentation protein Fic [Candidatus Moranbacteria bacterium]
MKKDLAPKESEILLYTTPNGEVKIDVFFHNETVWLTQKKMAELFGVEVPAISKHLKNIFDSGELNENSVVSILENTAEDGKNYQTKFYNLDAIIAVGYRVNSHQATQFRIWATQTLKEFIIKGFVMDDERLKNGHHFGKDYFEELLERVRAIRASERRVYLKVTDIFAECAIDYDPKSEITKKFYAGVQNKFHYAITHHTGAEIVYKKVDAKKPNLGMTTFKNAPKGQPTKADTTIAKNYLKEEEIKELESLVSSYFDYIERMIKRKTKMTMESLSESINKFLEFNEYEILEGCGKISHKQMEKKAHGEYAKYLKKEIETMESDFEKEAKKMLKKSQDK